MSKKIEFRTTLKTRLRELTDRSGRSEKIWHNLADFPPFRQAVALKAPVMVYVDLPNEVETARFLTVPFPWASSSPDGELSFSAVVPYCENGNLRLFRLLGLEELRPYSLGIREPKSELRTDPSRQAEPDELALILLPGLGFDLSGGRLGRGGGYYDRFLSRVPANVPRVGLAFECQLLERIPMQPHDQKVDWIVTENRTIRCQGMPASEGWD